MLLATVVQVLLDEHSRAMLAVTGLAVVLASYLHLTSPSPELSLACTDTAALSCAGAAGRAGQSKAGRHGPGGGAVQLLASHRAQRAGHIPVRKS